MQTPESFFRSTAIALALLGIGCATPTPVDKVDSRDIRVEPVLATGPRTGEPASGPADPIPQWAATPLLSPGDRIQIEIADGENFNGRYEVDVDGALKLPYLEPLAVAGQSVRHLEVALAGALTEAELFKPSRLRVSARVHEWSHIQVNVSGAVFNPGRVTINARRAEDRALKQHLASGDFPSERLLAAALRAAGGVRPDAAIDRIQLLRNGRKLELDYRGPLLGRASPQVPLTNGDVIYVPESGRFDQGLLTISPITPPGIRVFLSNLTVPAFGNAASAVSQHSTSLPYGSSLLTAAVAANCVGGIRSTNAPRFVVLVRSQARPDTQQVIRRPVEDLIDAPADADNNPPLQPDDSISCYDSGVTTVRDIMRTFYDILLPFSLM